MFQRYFKVEKRGWKMITIRFLQVRRGRKRNPKNSQTPKHQNPRSIGLRASGMRPGAVKISAALSAARGVLKIASSSLLHFTSLQTPF